ncbi:MAG: drug/metabolite transporter (DMT)-like permease [Motiliproteus sp.]|jgi:drug/metabolite transporter (DMT)-like permease
MSFQLLNWILLCGLVLLWGSSFLFTTIAVATISPLAIVTFRVVLGAVVLVAALWLKKLKLPTGGAAWGTFFLMGLIGSLLPFFLIAWGQQAISSGMAGVIMAIMPLATMLLAHYFIAGETLNRFKIMGFFLGIGGVTLLLGPVFVGNSAEIIGAFAVVVAACLYALNSVLARRLPSFTPLVTGAGVLIASSTLSVPIWLFYSDILGAAFGPEAATVAVTTSVSLDSLIALIWLGIGPTGIATLIYFNVIQRAGPTFFSTINYLIPAVAFFAGALFLDEPVTLQNMLALSIVLLGIGLTRYRA